MYVWKVDFTETLGQDRVISGFTSVSNSYHVRADTLVEALALAKQKEDEFWEQCREEMAEADAPLESAPCAVNIVCRLDD